MDDEWHLFIVPHFLNTYSNIRLLKLCVLQHFDFHFCEERMFYRGMQVICFVFLRGCETLQLCVFIRSLPSSIMYRGYREDIVPCVKAYRNLI